LMYCIHSKGTDVLWDMTWCSVVELYSFSSWSLLRQDHTLFQNDFSTEDDSSAPYFNLCYTLLSLKSSNSCLCFLHLLPVTSFFCLFKPLGYACCYLSCIISRNIYSVLQVATDAAAAGFREISPCICLCFW
jgi:hypothetical protein